MARSHRPLRLLLMGMCSMFPMGCGDSDPVPAPSAKAAPVAGMKDFDYFCCDGGPRLVLPLAFSSSWSATGMAGVLDPASNYGRACAATKIDKMALIAVGTGQAIVLQSPPMSAWGHSPEGMIDVYDLQAWPSTDMDAMVHRAVVAIPTAAMTDIKKTLVLPSPDMVLLFAGEAPGTTAYGQCNIPIAAGTYRILQGDYSPAANEKLIIYRLQPVK